MNSRILILVLLLSIINSVSASYMYSYNEIPDGFRPIQPSLFVKNGTGTSNSTHLYVECIKSNCGDLRFHQSSINGTIIPMYWKTYTTDNTTWGEVQLNITQNGSVFVVYADENVSAQNNTLGGINTYTQFRDNTTTSFLSPLSVNSTQFIYETSLSKQGTNVLFNFGVNNKNNVGTGDAAYITIYDGENRNQLSTENNGTLSYYNVIPVSPTGTRTYKIVKNESELSFYMNNTYIYSLTTNLINDYVGLYMGITRGTPTLNYGFVRTYVYPEPSFDSYWYTSEEIYIPDKPINLTNKSGHRWINFTWEANNSVNITDSFNSVVNGVWVNDTNNYRNISTSYGNWTNISVYSLNESHRTLSLIPTTMTYIDLEIPLSIVNTTGDRDTDTTIDLLSELSFGISVNLNSNITWYLDDKLIQTNESVFVGNFTYIFNQSGRKNITAIATNNSDSVKYIWTNNLVEFDIPSDYIWTPVQDWGFTNMTNIKLDVVPPRKLGSNIITTPSNTVKMMYPSQFKINNKIYVCVSKYQYPAEVTAGLYCANSTNGINFGQPVLMDGVPATSDYGGIAWLYKPDDSLYFYNIYNISTISKGRFTKADLMNNTVNTSVYYPGASSSSPSQYMNYNVGWEGAVGFIQNKTAIIAFGHQFYPYPPQFQTSHRRISYLYFNSTNLSNTTLNSNSRWLPGGIGADIAPPYELIDDSEIVMMDINNKNGHEYHSLNPFSVPYEKGYYGAMEIITEGSSPQHFRTALWRTDEDNLTIDGNYGWATVGTGDYTTIQYLINNDRVLDNATAKGAFAPMGMIEMFNGSQWYYYYSSGNGSYEYDDMSNVSMVISDAHRWAVAKLNDTNISGSFETGTIGKNNSTTHFKFYANDNVSSLGGNVTYDIYNINGTLLLPNINISDSIDIPNIFSLFRIRQSASLSVGEQ